MEAAWMATRVAAERLCSDPEAVSRIANLSIVAAAAKAKGLLATNTGGSASASLRDAIAQIALTPLPRLGGSERAWAHLAVCAGTAAAVADTPERLDQWIAAWQAATPTQKTLGAYATPWSFAMRLAEAAVKPLCRRASFRVVDPSAGAGSLLLACFEVLTQGKPPVDRVNVVYRLHGVELDPVARELCCHLLWLAAAPGRADLRRIAENIAVDNAITRDWWSAPGGIMFDALVMNPPWESLRHEVGEHDFHAGARKATLERLGSSIDRGQGLPPLFSLQGRGDRNLVKAFLELAPHLLKPRGRLAALIPGAFSSDFGMARLRELYLDHLAVERWTGFENLQGHFPIDSRYKFGVLIGRRSMAGTKTLRTRSFSTLPEEIAAGHIKISRNDLVRLGGVAEMIPELRNLSEKRTLSHILEAGVPFFSGGPFGEVTYRRELDMTLDRKAGEFVRFEDAGRLSPLPDGSFLGPRGRRFVPLVEGRMVSHYDCFQKSWVSGSGRRAQWEDNGARPLVQCRPQFVTSPHGIDEARVAICDVTSATNTRTVLAAMVPTEWRCGNTAPVLVFPTQTMALAAIAVLNSLIFDWVARRMVSGLHLNKFYLEAMVWPNISKDRVDDLASISLQIMKQNPRMTPEISALPASISNYKKISFRSRIHMLSSVEAIVANGYGLNKEFLKKIYSGDRSDRRGFWRYFDNDKENYDIAREAIASCLIIKNRPTPMTQEAA